MGDTTVDQTKSTDDKNQFTPISSQEELNKIVEARLARDRKNREPVVPDDYEALKEAAARLQEIEDGEKSELQKAKDQIATLQQEKADLESATQKAQLEALRSTIASEKGIPAGLLRGNTKEEMEALADELLEFRGIQSPTPVPPSGTGDPAENEASVSSGRERAKTK